MHSRTPALPAWWIEVGVILAACIIGVGSARYPADSANDSSRLAAVECLVDYGTLAIDHSVFVAVPPHHSPPQKIPYTADVWCYATIRGKGTGDKMFINGHYYSDKPPTQILAMAAVYKLVQVTTGLKARERPDWFCYLMVLASCGVAYVIAVWFLYRLSLTLHLPIWLALLMTASFGLATMVPSYACYVNNHIVQLALAMVLFERLATYQDRSGITMAQLALIGTLAALVYVTEQAAGGLLLAGAFCWVLWRWWGFRSAIGFALGAIPWLLIHHVTVYSFTGCIAVPSANPAFFQYPGSEFDETTLTGHWNHPDLFSYQAYAVTMLTREDGDKYPRGFLVHNLPLLLLVPALGLFWKPGREIGLVVVAWVWCLGTWLVYSALSNNYSGNCCSIRWFLPLLAAGYFLIGHVVRRWRFWIPDLMILSAWGMVMAHSMWWNGCYRITRWDIKTSDVPNWLASLLRSHEALGFEPLDNWFWVLVYLAIASLALRWLVVLIIRSARRALPLPIPALNPNSGGAGR